MCGGFSGTTRLFAGSVLGRTVQPSLLFSACHLSSQSRRTSFFSCQSHCCSGIPVHSSTQSFRFVPGVASCVLASCVLSNRCRLVRRRIRFRIVLQASLIFCAIPECSSLAWYRAILPWSQRSSGGTYDSISSRRIDVALNAPRTV